MVRSRCHPFVCAADRPRRSRSLAVVVLAAGLASVLAIAGCGGTAPVPSPPPEPGYLQLRETFGPLDFAPLRGRSVVIDPGHGGYFRGALGPQGLSEADVNLGVALHLRGLLEWAGARAHLTRTADYDFLSPADSTLASDLAFRVSFTDSLQPDVFLSIHHNSTAARDETINETQTYYPLDDEGASLDLARAIHRHLVHNLEIQPAKILPGNFHVLRNATVPAVLGEPAMISHPVMEKRLSLAASQRLEAEAYFLGLLDYFEAGTPRWAGPDTVRAGECAPWRFLADGGPGPDPSTFTLAGPSGPHPLHISPEGTLATSCLKTIKTSSDLTLHGRNLAGRAAPPHRVKVLPAAATALEIEVLEAGGNRVGPALLRWRALGGALTGPGVLAVPGHDPVRLDPAGPRELLLPSGASAAQEASFRGEDGGGLPVHLRATSPPAGWTWLLAADLGSPRPVAAPWRLRLPRDAPLDWLDPAGRAWPVPLAGPVWIDLPGRLPAVIPSGQPAGTIDPDSPEPAAPLLLPALAGRCVVIDPDGGAGDPQGSGPTGLRGADVNLATAQAAATLLRGAGARVVLTREDGIELSDPDKVRRAEAAGADLFLTLRRAGPGQPLSAAHHPGSTAGQAWAEAFVQAWSPLQEGPDTLRSAESWAYLLRHTACPALEVTLPGPDRPGLEALLESSTWARAEARALLLSVAAALGGDEVLETQVHPGSLLPRIGCLVAPGEVERIVWDGNFTWTPLPGESTPTATATTADRESVSYRTGPGLPALGDRHVLELHTADGWQLWLLQRRAGAWSGRILLEGDATR